MVKTWVPSEDEQPKGMRSILTSGLAGIEASERSVPRQYENLPLSELREKPASQFVKTQQRWCNKFVAESYSYANIEKEKNKASFNIVLNAINNNSKGQLFDVNEVLSWIGSDASNISDGTLQRKILSWMVCLGILQLNHIKVKDAKGKEKMKYGFIKNTEISPCPLLVSGKCTFDWKNAAVTDYFPPEYRKTPDEEE